MLMFYYVYANGDYYYSEDYPEGPPSYMSDDYSIVEIPDLDGEDPEDWLHEQILAVNLGTCCEQRKIV